MKSQLSPDAILDISLGFHKHYTLQVLRLQRTRDALHLVLYDGRAIIGGLYTKPSSFDLQPFDLIRITCEFHGENQPVLVKEFLLLQQGITAPLGNQFLTLNEYRKLRFLTPSHQNGQRPQRNHSSLQDNIVDGQPCKKICLLNGEVDRRKSISHQEGPTQRLESCKSLGQSCEETATQRIDQPKRFIDLEEVEETGKTLSKRRQPILKEDSRTVPRMENHILISNLFENMCSFRIICRVNFVWSERGGEKEGGVKAVLRDEKGDEIVAWVKEAVYKGLFNKRTIGKLWVGRTYQFEGGEVQRSRQGRLTLAFSWEQVQELPLRIAQFDPSRVIGLEEVLQLESSVPSQITLGEGNDYSQQVPLTQKDLLVCGIFGGAKYAAPKALSSTMFLFKGFLLDPISKKQIDFTLYLPQRQFLERGKVLLLHNVRLTMEEQTRSLVCGPLSYYSDQSSNGVLAARTTLDWEQLQYHNTSQPTFMRRTIPQLLALLGSVQPGYNCYSQIECRLAEVAQRQHYDACAVCFVRFAQRPHEHGYCARCKGPQLATKKFIYKVTLADSGASFETDLRSESIAEEVGLGKEVARMGAKERIAYLELCRFTQLAVSMKSTRVVGGVKHLVTAVGKGDHKSAIHELRVHSANDRVIKRESWV